MYPVKFVACENDKEKEASGGKSQIRKFQGG
jgi:hypothetical protein